MINRVASVLAYVWHHPANAQNRLKAVARAGAWQTYKRLTGRSIDVSVYGGYRLRCYPDSTSASAALYTGGYPDWKEMLFVKHYLRPGDGFVDVGANVGVYTLLAASIVGPSGQVASFEPGGEALRRLKENVSLNRLSNVDVHPSAVSDRAGPVGFSSSGGTTGHLVTEEGADASVTGALSVRLDDVLTGGGWSLGKMDIEGAEPLALRGAERLLSERTPPVWLLEVNGCLRRYGVTEAELWDWLDQRGWDVCLYDPDRRILTGCGRPSSEYLNVIAVARAARAEVKARLRGGG